MSKPLELGKATTPEAPLKSIDPTRLASDTASMDKELTDAELNNVTGGGKPKAASSALMNACCTGEHIKR